MEQDGGWNGRKSVDKSLLKNIIRHTDAHNKIQEQNEMWKQWELKKQSHERDESYKHDRRTSRSRGYMRSDMGLSSAAKKESLKWNRLLQDYEETRKDRWGHSGYEELYPDEFQQGNGNEIESDESETKEKIKIKSKSSSREKHKKKEKGKIKKSRRVRSDSFDSDVKTDRNHRKPSMNSKTKGLNIDTKIRNNRERDRKMEQSKDAKSKRLQSKESRKIRSDSTFSDVESGRRETNTKELDNDFKTGNRERDRKVELNKDSKINRLDGNEKSQSKYIDNDLNCRDRKRKIRSDSGLKNDRRDKKLRSDESSGRDESAERSARKRNTDDTSRKYGWTVETSYSSKKKKKLKH
ncbi:Hypothetical predicted protein [Paramuricea clavata]|uniref:Uncharacterized protein n=1 Tax=Paramuricea clavata TaxID=317549 RepID=A0A6S7FTC0_PARCT|nr:Hypothetical predicted protein [Paramuricea clavata]